MAGKNKLRLYCLDVGYAYFGIVVCNDLVVEVAPIAGWALGKSWLDVRAYYKQKKHAVIVYRDIEGGDYE